MKLKSSPVLVILFLLFTNLSFSQTLVKLADESYTLVSKDGTKEKINLAFLEDGTKVALFTNGEYTILDSTIEYIEDDGLDKLDDSGIGISGRKVIYVDRSNLAGVMSRVKPGEKKTIAITTCINGAGKVTYVEIDENNTDVDDNETLKRALKLVSKYEFEPAVNSPMSQCGVIELNIDKSNNQMKRKKRN